MTDQINEPINATESRIAGAVKLAAEANNRQLDALERTRLQTAKRHNATRHVFTQPYTTAAMLYEAAEHLREATTILEAFWQEAAVDAEVEHNGDSGDEILDRLAVLVSELNDNQNVGMALNEALEGYAFDLQQMQGVGTDEPLLDAATFEVARLNRRAQATERVRKSLGI